MWGGLQARLTVRTGREAALRFRTSRSMLECLGRWWCGRSTERLLNSLLRERLQRELFSSNLSEYLLFLLIISLLDIDNTGTSGNAWYGD